MPLLKTAFNRRVIKTKRIGNAVWVLLDREATREPRQWIAIPEADFSSTVICRFVPKEGAPRDDAE